MNLGIIGCGKMGRALLRGILDKGVFAASEVSVIDAVEAASRSVCEEFGVVEAANLSALARRCEVLLLCVKPGDALGALKREQEALRDRLIISIVAGIPLRALEEAAGAGARVVRVMPNTPAQIGQGASAFAPGKSATAEDAELVEKIFGAVGIVFPVKEDLLDAVTGLSGSGPAFVYTMIEALTDAGVQVGLPREVASKLASQTVAGAAGMVRETGLHPAALRDAVTSPGGTTIAGLTALEQGGFRASVIAAVRTAMERSKELGSQ